MAKSGQLIILTGFSFFNELQFVCIRGGDIHGTTSFVILCNASMKRNRQPATIYLHFTFTVTQIFSGGKAKIHLHKTLKLKASMPISCLMHSRRHLDFERRDVYVSMIVHVTV